MPGFNDGFLDLPRRPGKPRTEGLTHVMDKGLNLREIEGMFDVGGEFVDIVKFGWGTSYVTNNLEKKIALYRSFATPVVCGGTLFEVVYARGPSRAPRSSSSSSILPATSQCSRRWARRIPTSCSLRTSGSSGSRKRR